MAIDKFKWVEDLPKIKEFAGIAKRISRIVIKEYLICLDDLERCDPELTMVALLGFVSQLKEENNCRIVLIFNHDKLGDKSSKTEPDEVSSSKKELVCSHYCSCFLTQPLLLDTPHQCRARVTFSKKVTARKRSHDSPLFSSKI